MTPASTPAATRGPIFTALSYLAFGSTAIVLFLLLTIGPVDSTAGYRHVLADNFSNPVILVPALALFLLMLNELLFHFLANWAGFTNVFGHNALQALRATTKVSLYLLLVSPIFLAKRYLFYYYEWPVGEAFRYITLTKFFKEAIEAGIYYPRWLPDLFYGYGYPTFLFYPPGYFYFSSTCSHFFSLLTGYFGLTTDMLILDWLISTAVLLIGAMGAYLLCAYSGGQKNGAICALLFMLSPYVGVNLQFRADMAELFSMMFLPYPFYFLFKTLDLARARSKSCVLYALAMSLALGLIFISHPATALLFSMVFFVYGAYLIYQERADRSVLLSGGILFIFSFAVGLAISSPYWLHVFALKSLVNLQAARIAKYDVAYWSAGLWDFFRSDLRGANYYQLGLPHFALAIIGALLNRNNPRIWGAFIIYLGILFSLTSLGKGLWSLVDIVRYIQFPWRVQTILVTLQIICIGGILSTLNNGRAKFGFLIYPALIFTFYWSSDYFLPHDRPAPHITSAQMDELIAEELAKKDMRKNTWSNTVEFAPNHSLILKYPITEETKETPYPWQHTPVRMKPTFRPADLAQIESGSGSLIASAGNSKYHIQYDADILQTSRVRVNQVFFPGWNVSVDGERISDAILWENARDEAIIKFDLEPGAHRISASYEGPPYWKARNMAIIIVVISFFGAAYFVANRYLSTPGGAGGTKS